VLGEQTVGLHGLVFVAAPEQVLGRLVVDVAGRRRKKKKQKERRVGGTVRRKDE
jgi:ribosomal protein L13